MLGGDEASHDAAQPNLSNSPTYASPAALTNAGMILGTAAYMSPEQARGQVVDARTDVWAFGCVLFEMLTGTRAFAGDTTTDLWPLSSRKSRAGTRFPPTRRLPSSLLRRCLTKDRKRRLAAAADVRLDLEEAAQPPDADLTPTRTRKRTLSARIFAATVVLAAIGGAYWLGGRATTASQTPATPTHFIISAPPGTQIVSGHREVATSNDGQQIAFIARGAADQHIYVRRLDDVTPRQIPGTEGARDLTFSPDGRWLAFHAANKIRKVSLSGGAPANLADSTHSHGLAWHAAEDTIYFAPHQASAIWKVAASGDSPAVQVTTLDETRGERSHEWPILTADGRTLIFTTNRNAASLDGPTVVFVTLATNARHTVRTGGAAFAMTDRGELLFVRESAIMGAPYADGQLSSSELRDPSVAVQGSAVAMSPNRTLAYIPTPDYNRRSLVWISPDGSVTDAGFGRRGFFAVILSPDGKRVIFGAGGFDDSALYVAAVGGGTQTMLTQDDSGSPAWSHDGKWLAGVVRTTDKDSRIARISVEPGRVWESLYPTTFDGAIVGDWTPDGKSLLVSLRDAATGRRTVGRLALDRTPPTVEVVVDSGKDRIAQLPAISPDGRWLAYESNELGRPEVYIQSYPTPTTRVQVSRDGGGRPMWTRRGDALYFVAGSAIMSSSITTAPEFRAGVPRLILDDPLVGQFGAGSRPFAVAPDGRILAIREDDSVKPDHIVVLQNWRASTDASRANLR
jgi:eukaryotic-like serine/threonine-protein kinase